MDHIGRYELLSRLGAGGMATVYLARALGPDGREQHVALKLMHGELAEDPQFVASCSSTRRGSRDRAVPTSSAEP